MWKCFNIRITNCKYTSAIDMVNIYLPTRPTRSAFVYSFHSFNSFRLCLNVVIYVHLIYIYRISDISNMEPIIPLECTN